MTGVTPVEAFQAADGEIFLSLTEALAHEVDDGPHGNKRRVEHDGVVVLLPTGKDYKETAKMNRKSAHALLWLAGHVEKG